MENPERLESALLLLPGEIRNRIYRLVAVHPEPIRVLGYSQLEDDNIMLTPRISGLAMTCQKTYDEIKRIYYEENVFNFTEYALRKERLKTFNIRAAESASKITAIKITRAISIGEFECITRFMIRRKGESIELSEFLDEFVNAPPTLSHRDGYGTNGICHCLIDVMAAKAAAMGLSLSPLRFVDLYLFVMVELDFNGDLELKQCKSCRKHLVVFTHPKYL